MWNEQRRLPIHMICALPDMWDEASARHIIRVLVNAYPKGLTMPDGSNDTPLHLTCETQGYEVAMTVFQAMRTAVSIKGKEGNLPIHMVCRRYVCSDEKKWLDVLLQMLMEYPQGVFEKDEEGLTPMKAAWVFDADLRPMIDINKYMCDTTEASGRQMRCHEVALMLLFFAERHLRKDGKAAKIVEKTKAVDASQPNPAGGDNGEDTDELEETDSMEDSEETEETEDREDVSSQDAQSAQEMDEAASQQPHGALPPTQSTRSSQSSSSSQSASSDEDSEIEEQLNDPEVAALRKAIIKRDASSRGRPPLAAPATLLWLVKYGDKCNIPIALCKAIVAHNQSQLLVPDAETGKLPLHILQQRKTEPGTDESYLTSLTNVVESFHKRVSDPKRCRFL